MAREWTALGHDVLIVTGPGDRGGEYSPDLLDAAKAAGARVHRVLAPGVPKPKALRGPGELDLRDLVEARRVTPVRRILGQWRHFPGRERTWICPATERALELHHHSPVDLVWTTSPPEAVHFVGHRLAGHGIPWVADFRDPWADYHISNWDPLSRWIIDRLTGVLLSRASLASACTEGIASSVSRTTDRRVICVRNGYDCYADNTGRRPERAIGYFGRVDPRTQSLGRMWNPLRTLRESGPSWRLEAYLSGGGGGGAAIAVPDDLSALVGIHPPLPHAAALERMREMSGLLVLAVQNRSGPGIVPGKLFEYAGAGVPALVCAPASFEVRRLAEDRGVGVGGWRDDEIVSAIRRLEGFRLNPAGRLSLSRRSAAALLADEFGQIVRHQDRAP